MVLQALARYYDILSKDEDSGIAPPGYSVANVSFALHLSPTGEILALIPLVKQVQRGKNLFEVPQRMIVPEQVKRSSGISANFLADNSAYVLGLAAKEGKDDAYARNRFQAFRELNLKLLDELDCPEARAVCTYLRTHDPIRALEHPVLSRYTEDLGKASNLVFQVEGFPGFVHQVPAVKRAWQAHKTPTGDEVVMQCLVTGEFAPVARLHPALKGITGANSTGATLVGFNAPAYESYNRSKGQGLISPVSQSAAFAYTTALNRLLSPESENKKFMLGDTTVVYWAESPQRAYADLFMSLCDPQWTQPEDAAPTSDKSAGQRLGEVARKVQHAEAFDRASLMKDLDPETQFYVLGLAPNAARVAVRFFVQDAFGKTVDKILAHYEDMKIVKEYDDQPTYLSLRQILDETVSKKASDPKPAPLMAGALFRAILNDTPYPAALYYALINRIRADMDDSSKRIRKINYPRAALIKAYLTRKYRHQPDGSIQEVLCMSLNEQSTQPAYLLGRLFAVLEKAQQDAAAPAKLNATIKDRYFTAACASPASVFPVLLRLSQHHISKAEFGHRSDRMIESILNLLEIKEHPIPAHLNLDEQGVFVLGYYHQRAAFYVPKSAKTDSDQEK